MSPCETCHINLSLVFHYNHPNREEIVWCLLCSGLINNLLIMLLHSTQLQPPDFALISVYRNYNNTSSSNMNYIYTTWLHLPFTTFFTISLYKSILTCLVHEEGSIMLAAMHCNIMSPTSFVWSLPKVYPLRKVLTTFGTLVGGAGILLQNVVKRLKRWEVSQCSVALSLEFWKRSSEMTWAHAEEGRHDRNW